MKRLTKGFVKSVRGSRLQHQAIALRAFGQRRAAAVIEVRPDSFELVLERIVPGLPLAALATEDEAMHTTVEVLGRDGWPPASAGEGLPPLADFASALDGPAGLPRAASVLRELAADDEVAVLHGDLHYGNVLSSNRAGWLLIDPAGVIGPPAFDIGYLVSRPMPMAQDGLTLGRAIDRRLGFLPAALGLDRDRVAGYAYVAAALSLAWAIEDGDASGDAFAEAVRLLARWPPTAEGGVGKRAAMHRGVV
jgi:streptomycin 6-kinase